MKDTDQPILHKDGVSYVLPFILATPLIISNGVHKIHGITGTYLKESITKKAIFTAIKLFNYETTI